MAEIWYGREMTKRLDLKVGDRLVYTGLDGKQVYGFYVSTGPDGSIWAYWGGKTGTSYMSPSKVRRAYDHDLEEVK